jgi:hypothetical protein
LHGPDKNFLRFLVETVHPVVRPDTEEARGMVVEYNARLGVDGWEIVQDSEISGKPVFGVRRLADVVPTPALGEVKRLVDNLSGSYIAAQAARLYKALEDDPALAIGTAKELLETVCKTILSWRGVSYSKSEDLPPLVRLTIKNLQVIPKNLSDPTYAEKTITVLLNSLGSVAQQVSELRNHFGTGHGRDTEHVGLQQRHARLVVGSVISLASFLYECHVAHPILPVNGSHASDGVK